ncbi:hypothetical protein [Fodinibius sediminis]|nr:hypothetical protein [Fodinibius sediminis]
MQSKIQNSCKNIDVYRQGWATGEGRLQDPVIIFSVRGRASSSEET